MVCCDGSMAIKGCSDSLAQKKNFDKILNHIPAYQHVNTFPGGKSFGLRAHY